MSDHKSSVAIIGAGIAGLVCASELCINGFEVTLFDKGRTPGGRTSTRKTTSGLQFDHGAQYFTARTQRFQQLTSDWLQRGVVAEWTGRIVRLEAGSIVDTSPQKRYVGVPGMSAMAADLATRVNVVSGTRILNASPSANGWRLKTESGETTGPFHKLVVTVPAPQVVGLLEKHPFEARAAEIAMTPCWAVMVAFASRLNVPWDGAFVSQSGISWAARNSSKPGRDGSTDCWVLHASPEWTSQHLDRPSELTAAALLREFENSIGAQLPEPKQAVAHRWLFSHGFDPSEQTTFFDPEKGLAVCGDWLAGGRVEGAFLAGFQAAESLLR